MERPTLEAWALSLQERSALWLQRHALALPPDRVVRRELILLGARRFAPYCVREAVALWQASTEPYAPVYQAFWQGVYDFMPYLGPSATNEPRSEPSRPCLISDAVSKRFYEGLVCEDESRESDALEVCS